MSESAIVADVLRVASERGHRLFVNAVGIARYRKNGRAYAVRYGCGGVGSPDLIGWTASGQFVAIEMKKPGERPKNHQDNWRKAALVSCPTLRIGWTDSVEGAIEILEG